MAKLEYSYHTFIHYYSLVEIYNQLDDLELVYNEILEVMQTKYNLSSKIEFVSDNNSKIRDIVNYLKFINHTISIIKEKLEIVKIDKKVDIRKKRGLINGLGSIVKFVTGNLDANDGEYYEKMLRKIKSNQVNINNQLLQQYSVNTEIINEYNKTINVARNNFNELKEKLTLVNKNVNDFIELEKLKDVLNQLNILYSIMLNLVQDIENSLTFCKLGTLHPSIISTKELYVEILKIADFYKDQLPLDPKINQIMEFENLIRIDCRINYKEIMYFLKLPLVKETNFKLYKLFSIPTKYENKYISVIPKTRYLLRSDSQIIGLENKCKLINSKYFCSNEMILHDDLNCESTIINSGNTENCKYTVLDVKDNMIKWIPEMGQYLAILPNEESLKIESSTATTVEKLQGVFFLNVNNSKVFYRNKQLCHLTVIWGHPKILTNINLDIQANQKPDFEIKLTNLEFNGLNVNKIIPIKDVKYFNFELSLWTMLVYFILIIFIVCFIYKRYVLRTPAQNPAPDVLFREGGVIL